MSKKAEQLELFARQTGHFFFPHAQGQTLVKWAPVPNPDDEQIAARVNLLEQMTAIAESNRWSNRKLHDPEKAGAKVLAQPDGLSAKPVKRPVYVRVFYRSMGDEILCFDTGPMSMAAAEKMARECMPKTEYKAAKTRRAKGRYVIVPRTAHDVLLDAEVLTLDHAGMLKTDRSFLGSDDPDAALRDRPKLEGRLIKLPSQHDQQIFPGLPGLDSVE